MTISQGEQWIIDNEGCCFRALVSYEADYDDYIGYAWSAVCGSVPLMPLVGVAWTGMPAARRNLTFVFE